MSDHVPTEVQLAVDALAADGPTWEIVMELVCADGPVRRADLLQSVDEPADDTADALERLQVGGIVQRRPDADPAGLRLSSFGRRLVEGLYAASLSPSDD